MKQILTLALAAVIATGVNAEEKKRLCEQEQTGIHRSEREQNNKHQGPKPEWHLLGLLHAVVL